jgi:hypothetical protein
MKTMSKRELSPDDILLLNTEHEGTQVVRGVYRARQTQIETEA